MKTCGRCRVAKPLGKFSKDKTRGDGLYPVCKQCRGVATKRDRDKNKIRSDQWYIDNQQRAKDNSSLWRASNSEKKKEIDKARYERCKVEISEQQRLYYERTKDDRRKTQNVYYENNRPEFYARAAKRRGRLKNATPSWCDMEAIKSFYRNCPDGYHVDHIIPLQGKNVSGLHVSWNLQYLPARENLSKGNRFEPNDD